MTLAEGIKRLREAYPNARMVSIEVGVSHYAHRTSETVVEFTAWNGEHHFKGETVAQAVSAAVTQTIPASIEEAQTSATEAELGLEAK